MNDEMQPYLLCQIGDGQAECATWRLELGSHEALALFSSAEASTRYRSSSDLAGAWRSVKPERRQLAGILRSAFDRGILYAVVDPDQQSARRVFELQPMLESIERELA